MVILGLSHVKQFPEIVRHHEQGTIPPTAMWGTPHGVRSGGSRTAGTRHSGGRSSPMRLAAMPGAGCEKGRARATDDVSVGAVCSNVPDAVLDSWTRSALDTERSPNMKTGDLLVGAFTNDQYGYHRPFAGAGEYRAPVAGGLTVDRHPISRAGTSRGSRLQLRPGAAVGFGCRIPLENYFCLR